MLEREMCSLLKKLLPHIQIQNIETSVGLGFPDLVYGYGRIQGWIELKEIKSMPKDMVRVPWRPGQFAWFKEYKRFNKSPYILCLAIGNDWYLFKDNDVQISYSIGEVQQHFFGVYNELQNKVEHLTNFLLSYSL